MLDYKQILELTEKVSTSELSELILETKELKLVLKKERSYKEESSVEKITSSLNLESSERSESGEKSAEITKSSAKNKKSQGNLIEVSSPMVGTFYRAPSPEESPFVEVNTQVKVGDTLCILEAMKLMNELPVEVSGTVKEICAKNGELVEYGDLLFRIEPD